MEWNNGILLNGVLRPRLLNIPFASCSFINLDFLLLHTAHFDDNMVLPFLFFNTFRATFLVLFLHFEQYLTIFYNGLSLIYGKFRINTSFLDFSFKNLDVSATQ